MAAVDVGDQDDAGADRDDDSGDANMMYYVMVGIMLFTSSIAIAAAIGDR